MDEEGGKLESKIEPDGEDVDDDDAPEGDDLLIE